VERILLSRKFFFSQESSNRGACRNRKNARRLRSRFIASSTRNSSCQMSSSDQPTETLKPVAQGTGLASLGVPAEPSSPATSHRPSIAEGASSLAAAFDPLSSKKEDKKEEQAPPTASKELKINDLYAAKDAAPAAALPQLKLAEEAPQSLDDMLADFGK
jgi:hypothetical protein